MSGKICATMTAIISKICVKPGDTFSSGDTVAILESMKMEMPVEAESAGTVDTILLNEGDSVDEDGVILTYK